MQAIPADMVQLPESPGVRAAEADIMSTRLELALEASNIGIWDYNCDTDELIWDDRMRQLYFLPADVSGLNYQNWEDTLHPDDLDRAKYEFSQAVEKQERLSSDFRIKSKDGEVRHIRTIGTLFVDQDGCRRMIGVNWDVTADVNRTNELKQMRFKMEERNNELHQAKARLEHISQHDSLTSLPNRRYLEKVLESHSIGAVKAVMMVDLDGFKQINDSRGHAAGDALLRHVSTVLRKHVRGSDFVARAGGDEFVVLCMDAILPESLKNLAEAIIDEVKRPFYYQSEACQVGASIGILADANTVSDANTVLRNADMALYEAKHKGRNCYEFFTEELKNQKDRKKALCEEVLLAAERCDFVPYYQPQFCTQSRRLVGMEVLARWRHPDRGILAPGSFLDIATELGVTPQIDRIILHRALYDVTRWQAKGFDVPKISVNVSQERLSDSSLIEELQQVNCQAHKLSFELVESIFLDDADDTILSNIEKIRDMGIDIELDDFGTAYTSLLSILKIRPSRLKIGRQLVGPAVNCPSTRQVVKSIIDISNSLNIKTVAEGIETEHHIKTMTELGCHALQGFVFGRPVPANECDALITGGLLKATG